jgi:hypothetical protein
MKDNGIFAFGDNLHDPRPNLSQFHHFRNDLHQEDLSASRYQQVCPNLSSNQSTLKI